MAKNLKPILVYESGIDVPQIDGTVEYFSFANFDDYPRESQNGDKVIILQKEKLESPIVVWPKLMKQIEKITEPDEKPRKKKKKPKELPRKKK